MAKGYASKLKKLTPDQLIFADRVINEALVDAQMGKLTRWTSLSTSTACPSLNPPSSHDWSEYSMSSNISEDRQSQKSSAKNLLETFCYDDPCNEQF